MLCQNCGKNEVNFHYTQVINGIKKQMALCDKCAKSLGLENMDFNMPINFSSFLGNFFGELTDTEFLPSFSKTQTRQCNNCKMTYSEFIDTGKFGCSNCYDVFENGLNNLLKNIQGSNNHIGRKSRLTLEEQKKVKQDVEKAKTKNSNNKDKTTQTQKNQENGEQIKVSKDEKIKQLNTKLKLAIKEERYEDAAKIRDEIKKVSF